MSKTHTAQPLYSFMSFEHDLPFDMFSDSLVFNFEIPVYQILKSVVHTLGSLTVLIVFPLFTL